MDPDDSGSPGEFDRFCTVTIQGGGLFGLSLLGQLKAVEESRVLPLAYAGASAGAIVATLAWAGYKSEEVLEIFQRRADDRAIVALLNPSHPSVGSGRSHSLTPEWLITTVHRLRAWFKDVVGKRKPATGPAPPPSRLARIWRWVRHLAGVLCWAVGHRGDLVKLYRLLKIYGGCFTGEEFEHFIDELLRRKYRESGGKPADDRPLTFDDFFQLHHPVRGIRKAQPALFLTTTDVDWREPMLVNSLDPAFASIPVAAAVRASAGFPLLFGGRKLAVRRRPDTGLPVVAADLLEKPESEFENKERSFVDGGVVINFPLWMLSARLRRTLWLGGRPAREEITGRYKVFTPMRAVAYHPVVHIGLRLVDRPPHAEETRPPRTEKTDESFVLLRSLFAMLRGGVRTVLEAELTSRVGRSRLVGQSYADAGAPGGVLDLHLLDRSTMRKMFDLGYEAAREELGAISFALPPSSARLRGGTPRPGVRTIDDLLTHLVERASAVLRGAEALDEPPARPNPVRANLFVPLKERPTIVYRAGMEGDRDEGLSLPNFSTGVTGLCFNCRQIVLCNRDAALKQNLPLVTATEDLLDVIGPMPNWILSVPVMDPGEAIDAETAASFGEPPAVKGDSVALITPPQPGIVLGVLNIDGLVRYQGNAGGRSRLPERPAEQLTLDEIADLVRLAQHASGLLAATLGEHICKVGPTEPRT